jgi:hypothetical protein
MLTEQTCAVVQQSASIRVNIICQFFKVEAFILVIPTLTLDDNRIIIIIMALQLFVGPWPLFQFLNLYTVTTIRRYSSL